MVLEIDDPACRVADVVGHKTARLATARASGLATLPGVVVPVPVGEAALARGRTAVREGRVGAARAETARAPVASSLLAALETGVAHWKEPLIARASSPSDDDGAWDGAFATVHGVGAKDLAAALRGCWSSAFTRDVLERCDAAGVSLDVLRLAVLIQPEVTPQASGTATVDDSGAVIVTAVSGAPRGLLLGWREGQVVRVQVDGSIVETTRRDTVVSSDDASGVADIARRVQTALGDTEIEWALVDGEVLLLQSRSTRTPQSLTRPASASRTNDVPRANLSSVGSVTSTTGLLEAFDRRPSIRRTDVLRSVIGESERTIIGRPAAPGSAVGRGVHVADPIAPPTLRPGDVLVAARPLTVLAPMLWTAGGLVTMAGSPAAHLIGVARSLGVPAVVACRAKPPNETDVAHLASCLQDALLAVDGDAGVVGVLDNRSAG